MGTHAKTFSERPILFSQIPAVSIIFRFAWRFGEIVVSLPPHMTAGMKKGRRVALRWKGIVSIAVGVGVFLTCLLPLRALMNYHEEHHLFRWTTYYLREQWSSWEGVGEFVVSFVTQFFYVPWLGAAIVALLVVALQWLTWWILKKLRCPSWLYPLSFVPALLLFVYAMVPDRYWNDAAFREIVEYDYLVRTQQWETIVNKPDSEQPLSEQAVWCTNYALAMRGQLADFLFFYHQTGPQGLLTDVQQREPLSYFALSNIYLQLGLVNNAERMAFDAKQYIPHNHKSGRLYRRLAETNLINGNYVIAAKYLRMLQSTLFYGQWARRQLDHMGDEAFMDEEFQRQRGIRLTEWPSLIPPSKDELLLALVKRNPENTLAMDYLLAYALLQLDGDKVAEYMTLAMGGEGGAKRVPRAVQECLYGNRLMHPDEQPLLDIKVDEDVEMVTKAFFHTMDEAKDPNTPQLSTPPLSQTYWYYHSQMMLQHLTP